MALDHRRPRTARFAGLAPWVLLAVVLGSGCSPPFGKASTAPKAYAPNDGRPTIVCLGDSLTAGDGAPSSQSYPAWLQRTLNARGYRYRVVNAGVSGNRVADGLALLSADVLRFHPSIVIVELGSNDPGHTPAPTWQAQLETIVTRLQARRVQVILGGLDEPGMTSIYRAVAGRFRVPLVWFTAGLYSRPDLWANAHHPDGAGYRLVMENVWRALVPLLHR